MRPGLDEILSAHDLRPLDSMSVTEMVIRGERLQGETFDRDPHGKNPHEPGAKLDMGKNRVGLMVSDFPRALEAVAEVATYGANKYTPHGWVSVPDGVDRYTDAMHRHLLAEARGERLDAGSGLEHAAMAAWNALARLELMRRGQ